MFHDNQHMLLGKSGVFFLRAAGKSLVVGNFTVGNEGLRGSVDGQHNEAGFLEIHV